MFGIENIFGNKRQEEPKNEAEEVSTEKKEESEEEMDKREVGLSQKTKEQLSARHALNPDGTVHIPADETFGNDQERAA
ncbi:MAG: hypothetical protein NUV64_03640 [Parcubacteria group bacterium]|nr:hypothetical protein [Parcubacteria group bacterium]MCR4342320.1 hypothetical protein [Patescibacteria group bacterium]